MSDPVIAAVVPLKENSARFKQTYEDNGAGGLVNLIVVKGQGHNFYEGFFHAQPLVDFAIERRGQGATAEQAIVEAALLRFRPIMMTTMAAKASRSARSALLMAAAASPTTGAASASSSPMSTSPATSS